MNLLKRNVFRMKLVVDWRFPALIMKTKRLVRPKKKPEI